MANSAQYAIAYLFAKTRGRAVAPRDESPGRKSAVRDSVLVRESTRTCCGAQGVKAQGERRAVRDGVLVRGSTRTCCGAQGIRAQGIARITRKRICARSTRTCCGAQGMKAQGERRAVRDSVLVRGCALCAGECRNAKARNVRWRLKSTCAHFAQVGAETRKHVIVRWRF